MKEGKLINCLLVDDDPEDLEIFEMALQDLGLNIHFTGYTDSNKAMELLESAAFVPDCIFMDNHMNTTDGRTCLEKIKTMVSVAHIPVIILSGSVSLAEQDLLKSAGAHSILIKTGSLSELQNLLSRFFTAHFDLQSDLSI